MCNIVDNNFLINSFSARPTECVCMHEKSVCNEASQIAYDRIKLFAENLRHILTPYNIKPMVEQTEVYYMESPKQLTKHLANYIIDVEVIIYFS